MFNKYKMTFTLYAVGQAVEQVPEVATRCVEMGHDVASHAYRWLPWHDCSIDKEKESIKKSIECLKKLTGYAPKGVRQSRFDRQPIIADHVAVVLRA